MRRTTATVATALATIVMLAGPASAHGVAGAGATNFETVLTSVTPEVPGVTVDVVEGGSRIQVTNTGDTDLVVEGYQEEPYLRVGPDGVFENRRSPATYLNQDREAATPVPGTADPDAEPEWARIGDGPTVRWHDHRIHWMSDQDPPGVSADPGTRQVVIPDWVIPMHAGDAAIEVHGQLVWVPGPSAWPWIALAAGLAGLTVALSRTRRWAPALAVLLAVLVVLDVVHAVGTGLYAAGSLSDQVGEILSGSYVSLVAWAVGVVGVLLLARRDPRGLYAAALAGLLIAFNGGVADLADLSRSQIPFAWSADLARLTVAAALGIGGGLFVAAALRLLLAPEAGASRAAAADVR